MLRVHVLSEPPTNQNTVAFLAPLLWHAPCLRDLGLNIRLFPADNPALLDCDTLLVNSKFWGGSWSENRAAAIDFLGRAGNRVRRLLYFDRTSSPGQVIGDVMPLVDRYLKNALYADRHHYLRPVYGGRLFSEYAHDHHGIADAPESWSSPLNAADLDKLAVSWNTGLANYSLLGPRFAALFNRLPWRGFFAPPRRYTSPTRSRPIPVSCRMGLTYRYATVAWQRQQMAEILASHRRTDRVGKLRYFSELRASRMVASPFGYSEINYKDFEVFLTGGVLLKPDMSHLETWPDLYRPGATYVAHKWDLSDVADKVAESTAEDGRCLSIAEEGQQHYRQFCSGPTAGTAFAERLAGLIGAP